MTFKLSCSLVLLVTVLFSMHAEYNLFDKALTRRMCPVLPSDYLCKESLKQLSWLKKCLDTCCVELDQKFTLICQKLDSLLGCGPSIPITQADIPFTISAPGNYCLAETVATNTNQIAITVAADLVSIDLNGFCIVGGQNAIKAENQQGITIKNGTLKQAGAESLLILTCQMVCVENVHFENNTTGCVFDTVDGIKVNDCSFVDHSVSTGLCISLINCCNGRVSCCTARDNLTAKVLNVSLSSTLVFDKLTVSNNASPMSNFLINVADSNNCFFDRCTVNNNGGLVGGCFVMQRSQDSLFYGCQANTNNSLNNNLLALYLVDTGSNVSIDNCFACNNTTPLNRARGFFVTASSNCSVTNSFAKGNEIGNFLINLSDNCLFKDNVALSSDNGFLWDGTGANNFFGNYAQDNTANYTVLGGGVLPIFCYDISTGVFTPLAPRTGPETAWDNISAQTTCL